MMCNRYWTKEEDELITDVYIKEGKVGISKLDIGRSENAIMSRLGRLGVKRGRCVKWSDSDIKLLKDNYKEYGVQGCKDAGLLKSDAEICTKARYLGIRHLKEEWSDEEVALLKSVYPLGGVQACIDSGLNRSKSSIKNKAQILNIRLRNKYNITQENAWTVEEVNLLVSLYPVYGAKGCILRGLNRTEDAIKYKARVLGIKLDRYNCDIDSIKARWTKEEIGILKEYYEIGGSQLCKEKGVLKNSRQILRKARLLGLKVKGKK